MHEKSITLLNEAVADELSAVHQYMYFHFHMDDQGYDLLASLFRKNAIAEMMHTERLAERILFLKGEVEMAVKSTVEKIHDVDKMLKMAKEMEESAVEMYNKFANQCSQHGDNNTKKLFEDLIIDEETHFDHFDIQEEHLKKFGEQFLALQSIERSKALAGSGPAEA